MRRNFFKNAMLLVIILAAACKKTDEKSELSPVKEKPGWESCPEGVGDDEWVQGYCPDGDDTLNKYYSASIYALLSNPIFFDKKQVHTCGYLNGDMTGDNCSIQWILYPSKEDVLHSLFTNALRIDEIEGSEIFRHMELPYGMYICLDGMFSSSIYDRLIKIGFVNGSIFIPNSMMHRNLSGLNKKLDSLLKEGEDISEFQWSYPCSSFEILKGKIRVANISPDCPDDINWWRVSCNEYHMDISYMNMNMNIDSGSALSKEEIVHLVVGCKSLFKSIYKKYLTRKPDISGKIVTLKFTIDSTGNVADISIVSSTTGYPEFDNAVKDIVARLKWQTSFGNTTVTIPLDFSTYKR